MIHYATPQRSDDPATAPAADPPPPPRLDTTDAPPGPISWEIAAPATAPEPAPSAPVPVDALDLDADGDPSDVPVARTGRSWDAVPHPVGPLPEPVPAPAPAAAAAASPPPDASFARGVPVRTHVVEPARLATAVHSLGPVGRHRSPVLAFVLAVVTLGLYPILWARRATREMAQFDPRMVVSPAHTAWAFAGVTAAPLIAAGAEAARILADHLGSAPSLPLSAQATRWLLLAPALTPLLAILVPFSLVAVLMTFERVRVVEDRGGIDPEHQLSPTESVWWTALPVVGLAVFVARGQARLNRVWEVCTALPHR
jgi:hypothetical protein